MPEAAPVVGVTQLGEKPPSQLSVLGLQFYQLAIPAPTPPASSFDATAAARGQTIFSAPGSAPRATCRR